ncbi:hypothetical protein RhiirA1_471715 [Rhizophagus irregularis]|uniref:Uncharacterized protein n=1 Tax=Rhizophagus irregularis TaxID=588596 RepID=A0A2N0R3R8_9GLOM|nr:hypothetical protein RhiirA1_471715 [Rhizophagus irregularis]
MTEDNESFSVIENNVTTKDILNNIDKSFGVITNLSNFLVELTRTQNDTINELTRNQDKTIHELLCMISDESATTRQNQLCIQYGLRAKPNILDRLLRERHLQTPQDVYHATAGKIGRLLKLTCELFSQEGENEFIKA